MTHWDEEDDLTPSERSKGTFYGQHQGRRRGQVDSAEYLTAWCFLLLAGGLIVAVFVRAFMLWMGL